MSKRQPAADRGGDPTINHGTVYAYDKKGCRCDACKEVGKAWARRLPSRQKNHKQQVAAALAVPPTAHGTASGWSYWRCTCELCREDRRRQNAEQRAKMKEALKGKAINAGKSWTEDEIALITRPGVTALQAALALGRPVSAVNSKRHRLKRSVQN